MKQRMLVRSAGLRMAVDAAHAAIIDRCGNVIGKRQIEDLVIAAAADVEAFYTACVPLLRTAAQEPEGRAWNGRAPSAAGSLRMCRSHEAEASPPIPDHRRSDDPRRRATAA
ncbi:hypothetical protein ACIBO2_29200 [Nonomuraea sp. NPDC050022]|uniref:hypothetical protein n=1 Tax=unclassified Nonomuraea TaxID=2593643 RepID=UPI0033CA7CEF